MPFSKRNARGGVCAHFARGQLNRNCNLLYVAFSLFISLLENALKKEKDAEKNRAQAIVNRAHGEPCLSGVLDNCNRCRCHGHIKYNQMHPMQK